MKVLYLSKDVFDYGGAFYQQDVIDRLDNCHDLFQYGSDLNTYDETDTVENVLSKCPFTPNIICIGHQWLGDDPTAPVDPHPCLDLTETDVPVVMILNKEYRNLEGKFEYIESNGIELVFTHHHKAAEWSRQYNAEFVFWPFAVNKTRFRDYGESKQYDLAFSGILRNPDPSVPQTDLRLRVQKRLFYTLGELKLKKRSRYRSYEIFWRGKPTNRPYRLANKVLHREKRLPDDDYKKLYSRSKLSLNTLSPIDLVGTRYYESMASNSLAFCQESPIYSEYGLFEPGEHCVTFSEDLSDFQEKLAYWVEHDEERAKIAQQGHDHVMENHTWEKRVKEFTDQVNDVLL
jgi:spore maturation protein CgeB